MIEITDEMRRAVNAEQCLLHGHSFVTVATAAGDPSMVWCERCLRRWRVVADDC